MGQILHGSAKTTEDKHAFTHIFDRICHENEIEHRLTKVKHPWTNGQVERMNRTIKEATVKRYYYGSHEQLKTLKGLTPYEYVCKIWTKEPERFSRLFHPPT